MMEYGLIYEGYIRILEDILSYVGCWELLDVFIFYLGMRSTSYEWTLQSYVMLA